MGHNNEKKIERAARNAQWVRDQKDRARAIEAVELWNAHLAALEDPLFMPTIHAALITGHHWMIVVCRSCGTVIDLDLRVKRRPPEATILMALRDVRCPRCNGHGQPRIMKLAHECVLCPSHALAAPQARPISRGASGSPSPPGGTGPSPIR